MVASARMLACTSCANLPSETVAIVCTRSSTCGAKTSNANVWVAMTLRTAACPLASTALRISRRASANSLLMRDSENTARITASAPPATSAASMSAIGIDWSDRTARKMARAIAG